MGQKWINKRNENGLIDNKRIKNVVKNDNKKGKKLGNKALKYVKNGAIKETKMD